MEVRIPVLTENGMAMGFHGRPWEVEVRGVTDMSRLRSSGDHRGPYEVEF